MIYSRAFLDRFSFSGQNDEPTDEDYNNNYDDYGTSKETSNENTSVTDAISTPSILNSTDTSEEHSTIQESESTTLPTIEVTVSTESNTNIVETTTVKGKALKLFTFKINQF